jgi:oxygen-independent coproporphyrinogen-3 oxidase
MEFTDAVGSAQLEAALAQATGDVSLYLHIPFCDTICWYCGCNTGRANRQQRLASYLDALHKEIALVGRRLPASARVRRIAFGGGSPNAIRPADLSRLMEALASAFRLSSPVVSVELDPRGFQPAWASALAGSGVTRASLGVQTFDERLQALIGRVQPAETIARCTALLRGAGITSLNYDLVYGLPGQDWQALEATLEQTAALGADRVALFGYAHVPHVVPRQQRIDAAALPGQAQRFAMAALGHDWLTSHGFEPVGFDHFARPGDPLARAAAEARVRRNFQGFTDDQAPVLIGLGASAISVFPDLFVQNEKNSGRYRDHLQQALLPAARGVLRGPDDRRRGEVIERLLCTGRATLPSALCGEAQASLQAFQRKGLAQLQDEVLTIMPAGLPYARTIAAMFDSYRTSAPQRFSSAV